MKLALAMIVKGTDEEAALLDRCLESLAPHVDGIFITRTQPNEAVGQVAKRYKATLSDFEWCSDFSAARNFNFSQVPAEYTHILWTDADDIWRGAEKLKATIEDNPRADAFGFNYLYDWDEFRMPTVVHRKTMIVKNDGCCTWVGRLHEDLQEHRALDVQLVEGIERLHLTNDERAEQNAVRNVGIALAEVTQNGDDPRSYWNLGNSHYGVADYHAAREAFEHFIKVSESDEEKYLAYERLSDICRALEDRAGAIRYLQIAIGLFPKLPDAYLQLAHLYYSYNDLEKAEQYCLNGMQLRPQPHRMIVYNPRDYDYNPMMLLAKVYYHRNRPDLMLPLLNGCLRIYPHDKKLIQMVKDGEADKKALARALTKVQQLQGITDIKLLKKELDKLPEDLKSHPAICVLRNTHFTKESSSGRDLVIYCGSTTHQWSGQSGEFIGGSEEAVINLSRGLAKLGWNVTVYNNCGHKAITDKIWHNIDDIMRGNKYSDVTYRPFWEWNYRDKQDVTVLWRWCKPLDADINSSKIFVDVHDVMPPGEFNDDRLKKITKVMVKSRFHRSLFPNIPDDKIAVVPNGLDLSLFSEDVKRDPNLIINTSSPDRSMDVLPKLFKDIKAKHPSARMQWAYGWQVYDQHHSADAKKMAWKAEIQASMKEAGIEELGRLSQEDIAKLYQQASILAYPTEFAEIDCISVRKAQAAGCLPVTTDFGALADTNDNGLKIHSDKTAFTWNKPYQFHFGLEDAAKQQEFVDAVLKAMKRPVNGAYADVMKKWARQFSWDAISDRWNELFV